jgi:hypothetical protein
MTEAQWLLATLERLAVAGWSVVTVDDGEEDIPVVTPAEAVEALDGLEEGQVALMNADATESVTLLVVWQGNTDSPEECICNYSFSTNLDSDAFDALLYGRA